MAWLFDLYCPRCGKVSEKVVRVEQYSPPLHVNCGDCLMNDVEIVEMKVLAAENLNPPKGVD